jgi:ABC-type lipoprotein export system ATPase subunit
MNTILSLEQVTKSFFLPDQKLTVLKNISITFHQNVSYAITGASGTGKSTLLHLLAGIEQPCEGKVLYNNIDKNKLTPQEQQNFLQNSLGLVFQMPYLIPELTVLENIILKGLIQKESFSTAQKKGFDLLEQVNLQDKAHSLPSSLSGGQAQRVALLRALFNKPNFLIADEPLAHLDVHNQNIILEMLKQAQKEWGMGVIISLHDPKIAELMDKIYYLYEQQIFEFLPQ